MFELAPANTNIKRIKDGEGQLPLHTALDYQADDEIIKYLIEKYPEGTKKALDRARRWLLGNQEGRHGKMCALS